MMKLGLQDGMSSIMEQFDLFHDHSLFFLLLVLTTVVYSLAMISYNSIVNVQLLHNEAAEIIWTLLPGVILAFIGLPSLKALYLSDEVTSPLMSIKAIGHQWYWSYEYGDFEGVEFDSFMESYSDKSLSNYRLLDVDNRVIIPYQTMIRVVVTSSDVIHCWALPSLGVKIDANPGRLNQLTLESSSMGIFYGQCSEICGTLHAFMPISVEVVELDKFVEWVKSFLS